LVYESDGSTVKEETIFVYSAGKLVEEYSTKPLPTNPTTSYTATDHLGSPRVITNSLGEIVSRRDFMPFGEEITNNIGERQASTLKYGQTDSVRQKFTGYQKDDETSLDFAEARMYENRHGRFTTVDPLLASGKSSNPQTFNRYVYCLNNPLIFTDPTGLQVGKWHTPVNSDGSVDSTRSFKYIINGNPTEGYREVTERNKRGELISNAVGLDDNHVIRFNPLGPGGYPDIGTILLDIAFGPIGGTPYYQWGYDTIRTDEAQTAFMRTGRVDDVSLEFYMTILPAGGKGLSVAGSVGKGAMESRLAQTSLKTETKAIVSQESYEIIDGVRRAKSFQLLEKKSITANVMDKETGLLVETKEIPIDSLLSPNKGNIEMITEADKNRFFKLFNDLKSGSKLKQPIEVNKGNRGIPLSLVGFDSY
jgi:RHS repeat-associated protein